MAKKAARAKSTRSTAKADSAEAAPRATGDRLVGSVWHNGKIYDSGKAADQAAFKRMVQEEEKLGDKNKDGTPRAQLNLQSLADQGVISGFGTKAATKKSKRAKDADVNLDQEFDPDAPAGGGVDATTEQETMEDEQDEREDED